MEDGRRWACAGGHSFDVARQGYLNLLVAGQRRSHEPGDSKEMVEARRRFLVTKNYDRISDAVAHVASRAALATTVRTGRDVTVLDVGCGDGHHTRRVATRLAADNGDSAAVAGVDVAKPAVALAARAHPEGCYAVASAADLPVGTGTADVVLDVFGPVLAPELARVVPVGGTVIAAHPGTAHLGSIRRLVYAEPRPHVVKDPLRAGEEWFRRVGTMRVTYPLTLASPADLADLFTMTPYRWHAPPEIDARLAEEAAAPGGFTTEVDVVVTSYLRRSGHRERGQSP
jgi:23S rRNA (guanine745-N1)-methyltransferase